MIIRDFWSDWHLVAYIPFAVFGLAGGVTHIMYRSIIANIVDKEIEETRMLDD